MGTYAWDSRICVYNEETLEYIGAAPRYHSDAIGGLACIYDKNFDCWRVFSSSWDQSVTVWLSKATEEEKSMYNGLNDTNVKKKKKKKKRKKKKKKKKMKEKKILLQIIMNLM